jgi:hypothetical protein
VRSWQAHVCPLRAIVQVGGLVYTLARDGSIKGWSAVAPTEQHLLAWREQVRGKGRRRACLLWPPWPEQPEQPGLSSPSWLSCLARCLWQVRARCMHARSRCSEAQLHPCPAQPAPAHTRPRPPQVRKTLRPQKLHVLCATWNVNERRPSEESLRAWLGERSQKAHAVCVALQEMEMGTSSVVKDGLYSVVYKWAACLSRACLA